MMVTITSMKKIQEPDLLLDQPHRLTNNLSKYYAHRSDRHPKNRSRRYYNSEESNSSVISASTTLTSVSSCSGCDELSPVTPLATSCNIVIEGLDDSTQWSQDEQIEKTKGPPRHKPQKSIPSRTWIRTKATSSSSTHHPRWGLSCCCTSVTTKQLIVLLIALLIVAVSVISLIALVLSRLSHSEVVSSSSSVKSSGNSNEEGLDGNLLSSGDISQVDEEEGDVVESDNYEYEESSSEIHNSDKSSNSNLDLKEVSRLSWNMLNSNQERGSEKGSNSETRNRHHHHSQNKQIPSSFSGITGGEEVVLPSKMIFTSSDGDLHSSGDSNNKKRSCCRTQKYSQVIKRDGCDPLTVTNRMCFGQCVSVWVPGLFSSFPVCKPSFSSWKTVTLNCGKNRDRKRRVRIEKVRKCSCMEIDPTAASPTSKKRR